MARRARHRRWLQVLAGIVALACVPLALQHGRYLLSLDPYARFRQAPSDVDQTGIALTNVEVRRYRAGELVGEATVGQVAIRRDRQLVRFEQVGNGRFLSDQGELRFEGREAQWRAIGKMLESSGGRVWNETLDLRVGTFRFDQGRGRLTVPGEIRGRLMEGQVVANNLTYFVNTQMYEMGPVHWVGKVNVAEFPIQERQTTTWEVRGRRMRSVSRDVDEYTDGEARDGAGEVVVMADIVLVDKRNDVVTARGNVRYYGIEANLTATEVVVYRRERRAVFTGGVRMLVKAEDRRGLAVEEIPPLRPVVPDEIARDRPPPPVLSEDEKKDDEVRSLATRRKYPLLLAADRVEYWYGRGSRRAVATGSPQARQQMAEGRWRQVWAYRAEYDGEREQLRLLSREETREVRMKNSLGDDLVARWFRFSTKEDEEDYEADDVTGYLNIRDDDDLPRRTGGGQTGGQGGSTGGGLSGPIRGRA